MNVVLFTPERAYAASLRHWGKHDAKRLAIAVLWGIYPENEAIMELAATLAWHAEQAKITKISCRELAASMLDDEINALDTQYNAVLQQMIGVAEQMLEKNRRALLDAANAAADIAREKGVPPAMIEAAMRIARWRIRRRA